MTTPNLDSIFARLKKPKEITPEMDRVGIWLFEKWQPRHGYFAWKDFAIALLDLVQRQDERIAGLEGVIRAQEAMIQAALEPVGVNGPPWDHHAAEDAADLILALRADNKRLREYALHHNDCLKCVDGCTCGLDALMKEG